ncbi:MAG: tRNA/rRNA methyltransferase [Bacteroidales bacterium]|jgi:tRNA/rRNA methyltransferase|nr:tRNA/rRNA methyltransferase [Bacteroidales bacterium]
MTAIERIMQIHFILVEPAVPENVGAAARAIKTMGFTSLRLVNTKAHLDEKASWLAHASNEILENAQVFKSLKDATIDIDWIIGTSAKKRRVNEDYYPANKINELIKDKANTIKNLAIVFGREASGLTNDELKLCDIVTSVPMKTTYPSLNLAQSVMIYAYTLSMLEIDEKKPDQKTDQAELNILKTKTENILSDIEFKKDSSIYNRIMERLMILGETDIHLLLSVEHKLNEELEK